MVVAAGGSADTEDGVALGRLDALARIARRVVVENTEIRVTPGVLTGPSFETQMQRGVGSRRVG